MSTLLRATLPPSAEDQNLSSTQEGTRSSRCLDQFCESFSRFTARQQSEATLSDECLVLDRRADLRPSQMVEQKLRALLGGQGLAVSHIQMAHLLRARH